jgi:hypothetical protein
MTSPPLFKYLDVDGAKLTLGNRTFRHAKPSTFEDLEDMTVQSVFPEDVEAAVARLSDCCVDVIVENIDATPTCRPKLAQTVRQLQAILKADPGQIDILKKQMKESGVFAVEPMHAQSERFVGETNEFMQRYRIFCVSSDKSSERMWEDYAQDHQGIVIRIEPNVEKNSKLTLFRPVTYYRLRPSIYDRTLDFMKDALFADQESRSKATVEKIICAKTLSYKFESEYRLAIPSDEEGDWSAYPYYAEEITELYLGLAMTEDDRRDVLGKAKAVNPAMKMFQASRNAEKNLSFSPL